jgi:LAGLIDADG-like domain
MAYMAQMSTTIIGRVSTALTAELQAVWLAGVIDSEGTVVFHHNSHRNMQVVVSISNTNIDLVNVAISIIEGSKLNPQLHKYRYKAKNQVRGYYQVRVSGLKQAERLLERVMPYLIVKRKQAVLALSYLKKHQYKAHEDQGYVDSLVVQMKQLNSGSKNIISRLEAAV